MGLPLQTVEYNDHGGGLDEISSPTKTAEDDSTWSLNVDYSIDGAAFTRNGSTVLNSTQMSGAPQTLALFDYRKSDGTNVQVVCAGTTIKHSLSTPANQITGLDASLPIPDMEFIVTNDDEYLLWGNGLDTSLKFNGTSWTNWSIVRPTAPTLADIGAGALAAGDYYYYVSYARTVGGVIVQESELSPISLVLNIAINHQIRVTIPVSSDSQVNARVLYRISPTSGGVAYRLTTIANNTDVTYDDNTATDGTIEAEYNNQAAPLTAIFEEFEGQVYMRDEANPTDYLVSKAYKPWNVPATSRVILDGKITCIRRLYNVLVFGTDRSIWTIDTTGALRRISSKIGILNNRCADGEKSLYIISTTRKLYQIGPSEIAQDEMDLSQSLSNRMSVSFSQILANAGEKIAIKYYTKPNVAKLVISCPTVDSNNDTLLIFNEQQSLLKNKPVWQKWDNIKASALQIFNISNSIELVSGDYYGFLWKLDDPTMKGDGAEDNGTSTGSNTASTLNDTTKSWTVNAYTGRTVRIIDGTGEGQVRTIASNTATELTVSSNWTVTPDDSSVYTVGGYIAYHFGNWKYVLNSYEALKRLWFLWTNANALGDYTIKMILQLDFDTTIANQLEINITLRSENTIWGAFVWGAAVWGSRSVYLDRFRKYARFRAMRVGFYHNKAGQPWQINNFAISAQDEGLLYKAA